MVQSSVIDEFYLKSSYIINNQTEIARLQVAPMVHHTGIKNWLHYHQEQYIWNFALYKVYCAIQSNFHSNQFKLWMLQIPY